jgi:hypothetical protein
MGNEQTTRIIKVVVSAVAGVLLFVAFYVFVPEIKESKWKIEASKSAISKFERQARKPVPNRAQLEQLTRRSRERLENAKPKLTIAYTKLGGSVVVIMVGAFLVIRYLTRKQG